MINMATEPVDAKPSSAIWIYTVNQFFLFVCLFFFFNAVNRHLVFGKYEIAKKFL